MSPQDEQRLVARGVQPPQFVGHLVRFVTGAGADRADDRDLRGVHAVVDEWDRMIDVNVRGLLHGIAAVLPHFQRQHSGHVVTVASIGAHQVSPAAAVYCGTNYAAWAITEGLRLEVDPSIRVTTISPGVVESELLADSISDSGAREVMRTYRAESIPADAIARAISYAIGQPSDVDVSEIVIRPVAQR